MLRELRGDASGKLRAQLAGIVVREFLKRRADDLLCAGQGRGHEPQALPGQFRLRLEQGVQRGQVVLPEHEQQLHPQGLFSEEVDDRFQDARLCLVEDASAREQRDEVLELVEHKEGRPVLRRVPHRGGECLRAQNQSSVGRRALEGRREERVLLLVVRARDRLERELLPGHGLHAHPVRPETVLGQAGQDTRVHDRRLAGAGLSVEQHAAVHRHEANQLLDLPVARHQQRRVGEPERREVTVGLCRGVPRRRDESLQQTRRGERDAHFGISRFVTAEYSQGTNSQTSSTMNRSPCSLVHNSLTSGSGLRSTE